MQDLTQLYGRQWIVNNKNSNILNHTLKIPAIENHMCNRCGSKVNFMLPNEKLYCRECINIGRVCEGDYLVRMADNINYEKIYNGGLTWQGELTKRQKLISDQLISNYQKKQDTLVHAVTGAGKTEMLFKVIAKCIASGQRACIATPRIDVVNELYPRFKQAFGKIKIGKYHGREFKEPENEQLTICTTHQLLKFYQAFDLLVIDEVDSFPYANNTQLHFGADKAVKKNGTKVFLTATPTENLLEEIKKGKLAILKLNRRFHGHLLPVPKEKLFIKPFIHNQKIHTKLLKEIVKVMEARHQLLLFVPRIEQIPRYLLALKKDSRFKAFKIAGVHAEDPDRIKKVEAFRKKDIDILVTTTILERGVTFKGVWVIIVAADDEIYTKSSLVQIAGRVGRDKNDPNGLILFCYRKYTKNIDLAIKEIKEMNQ